MTGSSGPLKDNRLSFEKWPPESQGQTKEELRLQNKQALSYQPMRERERESYL